MGQRADRRESSRRFRSHGDRSRTFAAAGALLSLVVLGMGIGLASPAASSAAAGQRSDAAAGQRAAITVAAQAATGATTTVTSTPTGTVTSGAQARTLAVSPYTALAPSGAQVTVSGQGYSEAADLWVAVCVTGNGVPAILTNCIGGAIPDENQTAGWGIVSKATTAPYPGAVLAKWDTKTPGSFTVTLVLPAAIGDGVDCIASPCAVYTRSSNNDDRTEDVAVPITFTPPPTTITTTTTPSTTTTTTTTSSSTTTTTTPTTPTTPTTTEGPTTSTIGGSATTVSPNSMLQTSVVAGGNQVVVFTGFTPGEGVAVTLFSDPISLPPATADNTGTVRIEFAVPANLSPGVHILQAIGAQSGRVGIAQFVVTAAATSASSAPTTSSSPSPTTSSSPSSTESTSSESSGPETTTSSPSPSLTPTTTAITAPGGATTNNLLWLWITLAVVVLVGAAAGIVAMIRARNHEDDDLPPLVVAGAPEPPPPGWSGGAAAPPPVDDPAVAAGDFGLLSGQEHDLLSGRGGPDATTQMMAPAGPEAPTQYVGPVDRGARLGHRGANRISGFGVGRRRRAVDPGMATRLHRPATDHPATDRTAASHPTRRRPGAADRRAAPPRRLTHLARWDTTRSLAAGVWATGVSWTARPGRRRAARR